MTRITVQSVARCIERPILPFPASRKRFSQQWQPAYPCRAEAAEAGPAVMQVEEQLGVRLFHRTIRKLSLTEEGQRLFDSVQPAFSILSSALEEARRSKEEVGGLLDVSAPRSLDLPVSWPYFEAFQQLYPHVQLNVQLDDHFTDLVTERSDVGFRAGPPPSGGSIARRLMPIQLIVLKLTEQPRFTSPAQSAPICHAVRASALRSARSSPW